MKKRFLVPLCLLGNPVSLILGIAYIGHTAITNRIDACNGGDKEICVELAQKFGTDFNRADEISNPAYQAAIKPIAEAEAKAEAERIAKEKKAEAERIAKEKEANKWQPNRANIAVLAKACGRKYVKPYLRDPDSYRVMNTGMEKINDTHVTVWVEYSATNGFGGRVREFKKCTYTR